MISPMSIVVSALKRALASSDEPRRRFARRSLLAENTVRTLESDSSNPRFETLESIWRALPAETRILIIVEVIDEIACALDCAQDAHKANISGDGVRCGLAQPTAVAG